MNYREYRVGRCTNAVFSVKSIKRNDEQLNDKFVKLMIKEENAMLVKTVYLDRNTQQAIRFISEQELKELSASKEEQKQTAGMKR